MYLSDSSSLVTLTEVPVLNWNYSRYYCLNSRCTN